MTHTDRNITPELPRWSLAEPTANDGAQHGVGDVRAATSSRGAPAALRGETHVLAWSDRIVCQACQVMRRISAVMARLTSGSAASKPAATPSAETMTPRETNPS